MTGKTSVWLGVKHLAKGTESEAAEVKSEFYIKERLTSVKTTLCELMWHRP